MTTLTDLLSGAAPAGSGRLSDCFGHLKNTLETLQSALPLPVGSSVSERMVRPFVIRSLMEVGCTLLIGRFDPFRLLAIAELQSQPSYNPGVRLAGAIQWTGDIIPQSPAQNRWDPKTRPQDMSRALLGDFFDDLVLRPAFLSFLDYASQASPGTTTAKVAELKNTEPNSFVPMLRAAATRLYSTSSKGVHHEFVLSLASYYDVATIEQLASDTIDFLSALGLMSHFADGALCRHPPDVALLQYEEISQ